MDAQNRLIPKRGTDAAAILEALLAGERLTSGDAWSRFGASRLAVHVHYLRRGGWPIIGETVEVPKRGGKLAHVAEYRLES